MNSKQLTLFDPDDSSIELEAYFACAVTGLDRGQTSLVSQLSDVISWACENHGIALYEPFKHTDVDNRADRNDVALFRRNRERLLGSDLLIYLSHFPSADSGQALALAYTALLPIIIISRSGEAVSQMVSGMPAFKVQLRYHEPADLRERLDSCLVKIKSVIRARKLAFAVSNTITVGQRIRSLRERQGLTRKQLAAHAAGLTEEMLAQIEESADQTSNPSLLQLRQIALMLKTTVADLVEPDMGNRVVGFLNEWLAGRQAARYPNISEKDTRKIMRRMLLRVIDSLERE